MSIGGNLHPHIAIYCQQHLKCISCTHGVSVLMPVVHHTLTCVNYKYNYQ